MSERAAPEEPNPWRFVAVVLVTLLAASWAFMVVLFSMWSRDLPEPVGCPEEAAAGRDCGYE